jgi:hypothetical protein
MAFFFGRKSSLGSQGKPIDPSLTPPSETVSQHSLNSTLWPNTDERYFSDKLINHRRQSGPTCVATCLAILTDIDPESFIGRINTQDPYTWSKALEGHGMKLAYCPTDIRRVENYHEELLKLNDLFLISYYCPTEPEQLLRNPDSSGWLCGSHVVVLHGGMIYDPSVDDGVILLRHHISGDCFTKRIFRVLPNNHERGL